MIESWKPVKGYEKIYFISSRGRLKNIRDKRIIKPYKITHGYIGYTLHSDGNSYQAIAHRLVAQAFIGDIENLEIDHINRIKDDNRVSNLEIVTRLENMRRFKETRKGYTCLRCSGTWYPFKKNPKVCG